MAEVDPNSVGSFKFPNFLAMMTRKLDENSAEDEIREAFKVFDNVSEEDILTYLILICEGWKWVHQSTGAWLCHGEYWREYATRGD